MPTLALDSLHQNYPDLHAQDPRKVLKTHILGRAGRYLIPVRILTEIKSTSDPLPNVYYDYSCHSSSMVHLDDEELKRLIEHSDTAKSLFDVIQSQELLLADKNSLWEHLHHFCRLLQFNSAHGGVGRQDNAASGAYAAIIDFYQYYQALSDTEKQKIPREVDTEISLLRDLSSNGALNQNATENMLTCIGDRRNKLAQAMAPHTQLLMSIAVTGEDKRELVRGMEEKKAAAMDLLITADYSGVDGLGIKPALLQEFAITMHIRTPADFNDFLTLSPQEICLLGTEVGIKRQIMSQLHTLDDLVSLCILIPHAKLEALLKLVGEELRVKLLQTPSDIAALLFALEPQCAALVCSSLSCQLFTVIKTGRELRSMLQMLNPQQAWAVCSVLKDHFGCIVTTLDDIAQLLDYLSSDQRSELFSVFKGLFVKVIKAGSDLAWIMRYFNREERSEIYRIFREELPA